MPAPFPADETTRRQFVQAAGAAGAGLMAAGLWQTAAAQQQPQGNPPANRPAPLAPPDKQPPDLVVPDPDQKKLGWAVVGLGTLSLDEILPAFANAAKSKPVALVSGHRDKALKVARAYGVPETGLYDYDNYDKLADNPDVDVIYVVLPNQLHAEYTVRGLRAGKHVLCEKPMAPTIQECQDMIDAAEQANKQLMIAYRLHYEPMNVQAIDWCKTGKFGKIKTITASNCQTTKAPNIRLSDRTAGGPVGDVGVYCINAMRYLTGEEPVEVSAFAHQPKDDPNFRDVPESVTWNLRFSSGILAHNGCSFGTARSDAYCVNCADGYVDMGPAFSYRGLQLRTFDGDALTEHKIKPVDQFASEMDHFSGQLMKGEPNATPGAEGLADQKVVVAVNESMENGGKVVRIG